MYTYHTEGAGKNFAVLLLVVMIAVGVGWAVFMLLPLVKARSLLISLWPISAIVASLVTAVLYKLVSDTATIGKLNFGQRFELNKIVKKKVVKLWIIVAAIILPVIVALVSGVMSSELWAARVVSFSFGMAAGAVLCAIMYVPSVWLDLRSFVVALDVEKNEAEKIQAATKKLKGE